LPYANGAPDLACNPGAGGMLQFSCVAVNLVLGRT